MKSRNQRSQWAEHLRDEAVAQEAQQVSAGSTHAPVRGPLPHTADDLEQAVTLAVRMERERCASIADRWATKEALLAAFAELTESELRAAGQAVRAIGKAIRDEPGR